MKKVEGGYEGRFEGLPNSELTFSIVQENAAQNVFIILFLTLGLIVAAFTGSGWIIVVGIIILILVLRGRKSKTNEHNT